MSEPQKDRKTDEQDPQTSDDSNRKPKVKFESSEKVHKRNRIRNNNEAARKFCKPCGPSLTDLPDELLLVVLRSLTAGDLRSLGQVSSRFVNVVADHKLWVSPDFCHQRGLSFDQFCKQYLPFLGPWTTSVATRGPLLSLEPARLLPGVDDYLSAEFLRRLEKHCPNLKSLVLRDHHIDVWEVWARTLPHRLERLSLRHCGLTGTQPTAGDSYFSDFHRALAHLQELEIERCPWFDSHSLEDLSKCAHLRVLRITQCPGIVNSLYVGYLSCQFGFKRLEVLDLRQTPVGDNEVICFSMLPRLEELLLQRPRATVTDSSDSSKDSDAEMPRGRRPRVNCVDAWDNLERPVSDTGIFCFLGKGTRAPPGDRDDDDALTENDPLLRKLVVRGFSRVTDASVFYLVSLNTLRHLDLTGCRVTRHALKSFAALRPEVEVVGLQRQSSQ